MPANFDTGFCVRTPSWHKQELLLSEWPGSWAEARPLAGLDWDPVAEPVYAFAGTGPDGITPVFEVIPDFQRISRSDNHKTLHVSRDTLAVIDHTAIGEIFEAILEQDNIRFDTAGSLDGGRAVWALAILDEPITLPGDNTQTYPYVVVVTRHDGLGALKVFSTEVRTVCQNTLQAGEYGAEERGTTFTFRHTRNWRDRLDAAREAIRGVRLDHQAYIEFATELLGIPVTAEQTKRFVTEFIPSPPDGVISDRVANNIQIARGQVFGALNSKTCETVQGTAYGLVQAAGEYLDHLRRSNNQGTYLNRTLLRPEPLKAKAIKLAREVAYS